MTFPRSVLAGGRKANSGFSLRELGVALDLNILSRFQDLATTTHSQREACLFHFSGLLGKLKRLFSEQSERPQSPDASQGQDRIQGATINFTGVWGLPAHRYKDTKTGKK